MQDLVCSVSKKIKPYFDNIDEIVEWNQIKVIKAMQEEKISEAHFYGTTGYGFDDFGRDAIERIYAKIFNTEDALVRMQFVSGTHALTTAFFGLLRPGDTLLSATGRLYDTLTDVISGKNVGSLADFNIDYKEFSLIDDNEIDTQGIIKYIKHHKVRVIEIQRSGGYSKRRALKVEEIDAFINDIRAIDSEIIVLLDNCYGEFTKKSEPMADVIVGSLIKNMGGGLVPTGAYIAGKKEYISLIAQRHTSPGIGKEQGATMGFNKSVLQGVFMAPHIVGQALKSAVFASALLGEMGFYVSPAWNDERDDIIQSIYFNNKDKLIKFCQGIQEGSPIDSHVVPLPWAMPGYSDEVIMAAGTFNQGASIELSADAPIREPYVLYMQGGLTFESAKYSILTAIRKI